MKIANFNFTKGELDPDLHGRTDLTQYGASAKIIRNWVIQKAGGLKTRPGTLFVGEVDDVEDNVILLPFDYGIDFSYIVAPQDGYARVLSLGGMVSEEDLGITAVVKGASTTLTIPFHSYEVGDRLFFRGVEGMEEINYRFCTVILVIDEDNVVVDIDSTGFTDFVSATGTIRTEAPAPPPPPPPPPAVPPPPPPPPPSGGGGIGDDYGDFR